MDDPAVRFRGSEPDLDLSLDQGNVESYTYNYDYTKRTSYGWIFLPALGCRVEF